jgi:hypothetical protein
MALRSVAEMAEKMPDVPLPDIEFKPNKKDGTVKGALKFNVWGSSVSYYGDGSYAERKRLGIENTINAIVDAYGPDLAWVANDPSEDGYAKSYFQLKAEWHGMEIEICTLRSDVGEDVTVIESGPQVITDGDTIQLVRQSATVWKPNISIGRRATPAYELEPKPLVLALTEGEVF